MNRLSSFQNVILDDIDAKEILIIAKDLQSENDRLREALGVIWRGMWSEQPTLKEARNIADKALHPNKESEHG